MYGLDPQSLKISVFKGDVQLNNLHLKPDALNALGLPITVKAGLLGSLTLKAGFGLLSSACIHNMLTYGTYENINLWIVSTMTDRIRVGLSTTLMLQVPWASLGRAPVLVELDRLYLLAGPKEEFEEHESDLEQVYTAGEPTDEPGCH